MSWNGLTEVNAPKSYVAVFAHDADEHVWLVHIKGIAGCHTYGRTIRQAESRIREALEVWLNRAPEDLVITSAFPRDVALLADRVSQARSKASQAGAEAQDAAINAAQRLQEMGLSRRDTAALLGVSHQRVQQLLAS